MENERVTFDATNGSSYYFRYRSGPFSRTAPLYCPYYYSIKPINNKLNELPRRKQRGILKQR